MNSITADNYQEAFKINIIRPKNYIINRQGKVFCKVKKLTLVWNRTDAIREIYNIIY